MFISILRSELTDERKELFKGMNGVFGGHIGSWKVINAQALKRIDLIDLDGVSVGQTVQVISIRGFGKYGPPSEKTLSSFFPFVDEFGQFKHRDWPGKVHSAADLKKFAENEAADLKANPRPSDRSRFGGWLKGPKLDATGHFRTEKYKGKWWFVDPDGYLFWSHGITGIHSNSSTILKGREHYFEDIPEDFIDRNKIQYAKANLQKKYGDDWADLEAEQSIARLNSWGMNTIANWSSQEIYEKRKVPYVVAIHYAGLKKGTPVHKDPEGLRKALTSRMEQEIGHSTDDPWCIGYFVDNELKWQDVMEPELYFQIVSSVVKKIAPDKLYMGSRMHGQTKPFGSNPKEVSAAAKYCDVLSFNRYRFSPSDLKMLDGVDLPIIIGEFHFGALDRGLPHHGLKCVANQKQRAYAYQHYLVEALKHPNIVGTHWFQFREQVITGRADGENYQIGFVDICDTPYEYLVSAARRIGRSMYRYRAK